ncbi:MAG: dihydroorotase [Deltaproteobacteria bacterium]|nr:dihydroorotase [Deltaproteobacteria bacterium]
MNRLVIKGGRLIDPSTGMDGLYNIYVMAGRVARVQPVDKDTTELALGAPGLDIIDATGLMVTPGFIDLHTHLREPGCEYKETIRTGALSAAAGGFTTILCMANTNPVNDNASITRFILRQAEETGVNVLPIGAVSVGQNGETLTEMAELKDAGCVALSDDGVPVSSISLMRRALEYGKSLDMPIISHAEDKGLARNGVMNEGAVSTRLGLHGIPNAAEDAMVARDIILAELTGGRLHIAHVSTRGAVLLIRAAKALGLNVTAEAAPHHLALTDEAVAGYNTNMKMNPPLRSSSEVEALREGLKDGTIDAVATDHAPQSVIEKDIEFDKAANGVVGLETAFSIIYGLVEKGVITLNEAIKAMTVGPAKAMGLDRGVIKVGASADMAIIDLKKDWIVEPARLKSKSKNTPFAGMRLPGRVVKTIVNGRVVYDCLAE